MNTQQPNKGVRYYLIDTGEVAFTWVGGPCIRDGYHIWLTNPAGERMMRVHRRHVRESNAEETAKRLAEDRQAYLQRN